MYDKLIISIPHATWPFSLDQWQPPWLALKDSDRWTDWYTDLLFKPSFNKDISVVIGDISRFDCDLERLEDDPLEQDGRGILYTKSHCGAYRTLSDLDKLKYKSKWQEYQDKLSDEIVNNSLVLDCHSFPEDVSDYQVCIGFNQDSTKPEDKTIESVVAYFHALNYSVGINEPYQNSIAPKSRHNYHSLMIELNKSLYLRRLDPDPNPDSVSQDIFKTYRPYTMLGSAYKLHFYINFLYKGLLKPS